MQLIGLQVGQKGVVTGIKLNLQARKKLLTFGVGLGSILQLANNPTYSSLINLKINGKSFCIRKMDAVLIEVIKYEDQ